MASMTEYEILIDKLTLIYREFPQVQAIALGGSLTGSNTDSSSDIDLYVYTRGDIPLDQRLEVPVRMGGALRADMGMNYWGPGDEWFDAASGIEIDIVYFDVDWMQAQVERVLREFQPSMGYSTCFWYTVAHSRLLYDREGWFTRLQQYSKQEYPETLRENIIRFNYPVLRQVIPSYLHQVEKAVNRGDLVSVNHRLAAFLASYFDILFALNRVLHPGEKRLLQKLKVLCPLLPQSLESDVTLVLKLAGEGDPRLIPVLQNMVDRLDALLSAEGFCL